MTNVPRATVLLPHPAPLVLIDGDQPALVVLSQAEEPVQVGWVKSPLEPALGTVRWKALKRTIIIQSVPVIVGNVVIHLPTRS